MTTSGTNFTQPGIGELTLYAFGLCGIRRAQILQEHLVDARMAINLMLADWGNSTPNLWKVDLVSVDLVQGQATYNVDPSTIMILDAYLRTGDGTPAQDDRIIWPVSRTEYASQPNKDMQGYPTIFWFDRLLSPTLTLWLVPDGTQPYLLNYYRVTTIYQANLPNGETPDIPVLWLNAFAFGLAAQLSYTYAPDKTAALEGRAAKALQAAQTQNTENVPLYLMPTLSGYYSR